MSQILARSVLALFATTALVAGPAAAEPVARLVPAVMQEGGQAPQLILAATHHRRHHAVSHAKSRTSGHHHRGRHAAASADEDRADAAPSGAGGRVVESDAAGESYTVKRGDNLRRIAEKLGTDVDELKRINRIRGTSIRAGQVLKAPGSTSKAYVAARGDSLAAVARRFGVSERALRSENGLGRRVATLKSGQQLSLPAGYRDHGAPRVEADNTPAPRRMRGRIAAPVEDEAPITTAGVIRSVTGRVVEVQGPPRTYRVRRGDTLDKVSDRMGVSVAQLKKDNRLRRSAIRPGQVLRAPGGMVRAYVVGPGDTSFSIARRFNVSVDALRAENGIGRRGSIHTGQKLRLPPGYRDRGPLVTASPVAPPPSFRPTPVPTTVTPPQPLPQAPVQPTTAQPYAIPSGPIRTSPTTPQPYSPPSAPIRTSPTTPQPYTPLPTPPRTYTPPPTTAAGPALAPQSAPPPTDAQISEMGRGRFLWPQRGEILSDFGPKTPGQRNDGINIRANAGDAVRAAAAGDVVYAGDQVPGFGNLVLIKHPEGWVTAYGHLSRVEVRMQQKVAQGQEIGQVGSTGGVAEPQVHFEVRYAPNPLERARPVDPKLVLPK